MNDSRTLHEGKALLSTRGYKDGAHHFSEPRIVGDRQTT